MTTKTQTAKPQTSQNQNGQTKPLPDGWRWVKLGDVATIHPGQHIMAADHNTEGIGCGYLTGPADFGHVYPTITKWTQKPKAWCEPTDVLVTVKGAGVGKTNLAPSEKVAIGRQLMAVRPKSDYISRLFLYHFLITCFDGLQADALGSTVPGLSRKDIDSLQIPLPPLEEQKRIVAILRDRMTVIDQARQAAQAQLEAINALPAALLRQAFNGDL